MREKIKKKRKRLMDYVLINDTPTSSSDNAKERRSKYTFVINRDPLRLAPNLSMISTQEFPNLRI